MNRYFIMKTMLLVAAIVSLTICAACARTQDVTDAETRQDASATSEILLTNPPTPTPTPTPVIPQFSFNISGEQDSQYSRKIRIDADENHVAFFGGENSPIRINGTIYDPEDYFTQSPYQSMREQYSLDGSCVAIIVDWEDYSTGRLVYCDGTKAFTVAEDVDSFYLCNDGRTIAYLTGKYEHGVGLDLYLYDCAEEKSTLISEKVGRLFVLSPSGKAIAYSTFYEENNPDAVICNYQIMGQPAAEIARDMYCVALTDDAKTIYCVQRELNGQEFHAFHEGKDQILCESFTLEHNYLASYLYSYETYLGKQYYFNNDCSQVVFSDATSTWFSMDGGEPYKVFDQSIMQLALGSPSETLYFPYSFDVGNGCLTRHIGDEARSASAALFPGTPNLCGVVFQFENWIGRFDDKMNVQLIGAGNTGYLLNIWNDKMIINDYQTARITFDPFGEDASYKEVANYVAITGDGNVYMTQNVSLDDESGEVGKVLLIMDASGNTTQVTDLIYDVIPYYGDELEKLFILVEKKTEPSTEDERNLEGRYPFLDLYVLDIGSMSEPELIAKQVISVETGDFGIVYRQYSGHSNFDVGYGSNFSVMLSTYFSGDGEDFEFVMERPGIFYMGC